MSASQLFLVDTHVSPADAVTHAQAVYTQLIKNNIIEEGLPQEALPRAYEFCFKVKDDYQLIDSMASSHFGKERLVYGISINVLGHYWAEVDGQMQLLPCSKTQSSQSNLTGQRVDGFFYNKEGGFEFSCPQCLNEFHICDEVVTLEEALGAWCLEHQNNPVQCSDCGHTAPLSQWHSFTFAIGCFGVTFNGTSNLEGDEQQWQQLFKDFGFINVNESDIAQVYCED